MKSELVFVLDKVRLFILLFMLMIIDYDDNIVLLWEHVQPVW